MGTRELLFFKSRRSDSTRKKPLGYSSLSRCARSTFRPREYLFITVRSSLLFVTFFLAKKEEQRFPRIVFAKLRGICRGLIKLPPYERTQTTELTTPAVDVRGISSCEVFMAASGMSFTGLAHKYR